MSTARHGDVEIAYETLGTGGEPLIIALGVGVPLTMLAEGLGAELVGRGFHVALFDNRDTGLSTHFTDAPKPSVWKLLTQPGSGAAYTLDDMADDAVAVLDALGWRRAHVVGFSQGGMTAQKIATRHPSRVLTLTSIASTPSARIGRPSLATIAAVLRSARVKITDRTSHAEHLVALLPLVSTPTYPADEAAIRARADASYDRGGHDQAGLQRQSAAFQSSGDRRAELAGITVPTLVIHGDEDRIIRPAGGAATAAAIPGARLVTYPGMGNDVPRPLWPAIAEEIRATADRCEAGR